MAAPMAGLQVAFLDKSFGTKAYRSISGAMMSRLEPYVHKPVSVAYQNINYLVTPKKAHDAGSVGFVYQEHRHQRDLNYAPAPQREESMSKFVISYIEDQVASAIRDNPTVDVYGLARKIHADHPELDFEAVADLITRTVINGHGCAVWNRAAVQDADP
jgi:hypothetical protein